VLKPNSKYLISIADASFCRTSRWKRPYVVAGFESDTSCYFGFVSSKKPVMAKSAGEVGSVAQNKVGDLVGWAR